jgi:Zn-dependent M32 family carboxypeptidase
MDRVSRNTPARTPKETPRYGWSGATRATWRSSVACLAQNLTVLTHGVFLGTGEEVLRRYQMTPYEKLKERFAKATHVNGIAEILANDAVTAMPSGAADDRAEKGKLLGEIGHACVTAPEVEQWLVEAAAQSSSLHSDDRTNLSLMRREWAHASALSPALAREVSALQAEGRRIHDARRKTGNWAGVEAWYTRSFDIKRQVAYAKQGEIAFFDSL